MQYFHEVVSFLFLACSLLYPQEISEISSHIHGLCQKVSEDALFVISYNVQHGYNKKLEKDIKYMVSNVFSEHDNVVLGLQEVSPDILKALAGVQEKYNYVISSYKTNALLMSKSISSGEESNLSIFSERDFIGLNIKYDGKEMLVLNGDFSSGFGFYQRYNQGANLLKGLSEEKKDVIITMDANFLVPYFEKRQFGTKGFSFSETGKTYDFSKSESALWSKLGLPFNFQTLDYVALKSKDMFLGKSCTAYAYDSSDHFPVMSEIFSVKKEKSY